MTKKSIYSHLSDATDQPEHPSEGAKSAPASTPNPAHTDPRTVKFMDALIDGLAEDALEAEGNDQQ